MVNVILVCTCLDLAGVILFFFWVPMVHASYQLAIYARRSSRSYFCRYGMWCKHRIARNTPYKHVRSKEEPCHTDPTLPTWPTLHCSGHVLPAAKDVLKDPQQALYKFIKRGADLSYRCAQWFANFHCLRWS